MGFSPAHFAWLLAVTCVALAWRKRRGIERHRPPPEPELLSELVADRENTAPLGDAGRRFAVAELNQRLADVSFELDVLPATFAALIRISLAGGSALALVGFVTGSDQPTLERAFRLAIAGLAGLVGAAGVAFVGRLAKMRATQIRADWDSSSRDIGKTLGTSLVAVDPIRAIRGNRFPE